MQVDELVWIESTPLDRGDEFSLSFPNVVITEDVVAVEVDLWIGDSEVFNAVGLSRRDPGDKVDISTGVKLALGRAVRQIGRELLREGQDSVRSAERIKQAQKAASEKAFDKKIKAAKKAKKALKK